MKTMSLAVRCTREEYMQFCATYQKGSLWTTAVGVLLLLLTALLCILDGTMGQTALLLLFAGVLLLLTAPLILPTVRKGAAGRRYDASDALKSAVSITLDEQQLTVRGVAVEGCVPLTSLTAVYATASMIALVFARELTVYLPVRSLSEQDTQMLKKILSMYEKDLTV